MSKNISYEGSNDIESPIQMIQTNNKQPSQPINNEPDDINSQAIYANIDASDYFHHIFTKTSEESYAFQGDKQTIIVETVIKSTNELYFSNHEPYFLYYYLFAMCINIFQIILLYFSSTNHDNILIYSNLSTSFFYQLIILLIPFCAITIASYVVIDYDTNLFQMIAHFFHREKKTISSNEWFDYFKAFLCLIISYPMIFYGLFLAPMRVISLLMNQSTNIMLIYATAKLVRSYETVQDILFNFVGLLIILQIDNLIAEVLQIHISSTIVCYQHERDRQQYQQMNELYGIKCKRLLFVFYVLVISILMYSL